MICRKINHPFVQAVFQAAEKLGMPILFHMSPQEGYEYGIVDEPGLPMLEEALEKYPGLKFIGHSQPFWHEISQDAKPDLKSRMEWGRGPVREGGRLVCLMRNYKNLYADLSANSGGCAIMRDAERQKEQWLLSPETRNVESWPEDFRINMYGCVIWMKIVKKPLKRGSGNIKGRERQGLVNL